MNFSEVVSALSGLILGVSAGFLVSMAFKTRAVAKTIEAERNNFIAHGLAQQNFLLQGRDEEAIAKLERVLEDLDQEWHWRHRGHREPDRLEKLRSYIGNVDPRVTEG